MSYKTHRGRVPTLDFDWHVLAVVWMRPGGGGTFGGSLRSSRQAVARHPFTRSWATMPPEVPPPPGLLCHMVFNDGHNSLHSFSTTPLLNKYYKNAKVWSLFVHLFRGSGKTHVRMNKQYSTPNMRYQRIWQDGDECCCSPCTCLKFSRFRNKD